MTMMPSSSREDNIKIILPGSKSIINRILCMALYHNVDIMIKNFNLCYDVLEMLAIYDTLHIKYILKEDKLYIYKTEKTTSSDISISISESGTCLRFVLPYFAFVFPHKVVIKLGDRLSKRPISKLIDCLNGAGGDVIQNGNMIKITPPLPPLKEGGGSPPSLS